MSKILILRNISKFSWIIKLRGDNKIICILLPPFNNLIELKIDYIVLPLFHNIIIGRKIAFELPPFNNLIEIALYYLHFHNLITGQENITVNYLLIAH